MAIISSSWIFEDNQNLCCTWPIYIKSTTKREKAVLSHLALEEEKCTSCVIRIKYTSKDYDKASRKLKMLEEEEEMSQQESDMETARKLKANRSELYTYSDNSEDEVSIPKAPQSKPNRQNKTVVSVSKKDTDISARVSKIRDLERSLVQASQADSRSSHGTKEEIYDGKIKNAAGCLCKNNEGLLKEIITSLEKLKCDVKYLIQINHKKDEEAIGDYNLRCLSNFDELSQFNIDLEGDELFRKTCIALSLIGGKDGSSITRKILCQLISHKLALKLNWTGRNTKNGLKENANIVKLVIAAVRRSPNGKNSTLEEIEGSIKSWLRNAADRGGGRTQRKEKNI